MIIPNRKKILKWILLILLLLITVFLIWRYYDIKILELDKNSVSEITLFLSYAIVDTSKLI